MNIDDIIKMQKSFDSNHGWTPNSNILDIISFINKDIIGIVGELGEFSNRIKKINLIIGHESEEEVEKLYLQYKENLSEEVIDTFIYLIRIASHLNINIEKEYLKKLNYNKERYKGFEIDNE